MTMDKGRRLGRGLEALIPAAARHSADPAGNELRRIAITRIKPNPYQPRREFNEAELAELQASIRASGLLQPIAVREIDGGFELISGERRLRAVTGLGWTDVPALVKEIDDRTLLTLAMIENLQRANLNPVEEAAGYRALMDEFGMTQQQVADAVGKDRTTVAGLLRILNLPPQVLTLVEQGQLSAGHARALLALTAEREIITLSNETVARQLSVREIEKRVRAANRSAKRTAPGAESREHAKRAATGDAAQLKFIEDQLRRHLQTDVKVRLNAAEKGTIEISFYSSEDLDRLLDRILANRV